MGSLSPANVRSQGPDIFSLTPPDLGALLFFAHSPSERCYHSRPSPWPRWFCLRRCFFLSRLSLRVLWRRRVSCSPRGRVGRECCVSRGSCIFNVPSLSLARHSFFLKIQNPDQLPSFFLTNNVTTGSTVRASLVSPQQLDHTVHRTPFPFCCSSYGKGWSCFLPCPPSCRWVIFALSAPCRPDERAHSGSCVFNRTQSLPGTTLLLVSKRV